MFNEELCGPKIESELIVDLSKSKQEAQGKLGVEFPKGGNGVLLDLVRSEGPVRFSLNGLSLLFLLAVIYEDLEFSIALDYTLSNLVRLRKTIWFHETDFLSFFVHELSYFGGHHRRMVDVSFHFSGELIRAILIVMEDVVADDSSEFKEFIL